MNTTPFWGGGEKWHFETAEMMSSTNNNTFFICSPESVLLEKLASLNITIFQVVNKNLSFFNPIKFDSLVRFFRKNNIDTIIINNPRDLKLGGRAAKNANVETIVYRRGIAVAVKNSASNNYLFNNIVTHFIFNSQATKQLVTQNFEAILKTKKNLVLYNAIEIQQTNIKNIPLQNQPFLIGNIGRLVEQKGQYLLIEIAKKLKQQQQNFKIEIAGEGPLYDELNRQIKEQDLSDCIQLCGFVDDIKSFTKRLDVLISTALWEGFGFVLAEAMTLEKPILAFDLSSNPELIKEGENGFLIPPKNIDHYVEKLKLLMNDTHRRKTMGEAGYQFALENFEKGNQFEKLLTFLQLNR